MKTLILGASGLVGGNCLEYFSSMGWTCIGTHFSFETDHTHFYNTLDPLDAKNFQISEFKPEAIVHCGALTHVDYCEDHEDESYEKTVTSTQNIVRLARSLNVPLVYISTDYVFDGRQGFYSEQDKVNPLSVYAKHKLEAEDIVKTLDKYLICRVTNVYGTEIRGKNFVVRLAENMSKVEEMELKMPMDQYATPVNASDVARAIFLLLRDQHVGVFHLASTDYLNRVQLAQRVMNYFGHPAVKLIPISTIDLKQKANRPLLGGFNPTKFNEMYPDFNWTNVDDFLKHLQSTYNRS